MTQQSQQLTFDLGHRTAHGRDDFLISEANQSAVGWIDQWPQWPAPAIILQGPAASGKTHLTAVWRERTGATKITPELLTKHNANELAAMGEHLHIDPVDPWIGDKDIETTLFHLYNIFKEEQRTILLTSRVAPIHINFEIADLASRLRAAPVITIHPPDDQLLAALLVKHFSDRQLQINSDILTYLLPRMERSFAAARDIVEQIDKLALREKRAISIPLVRQVLLHDESQMSFFE